MLSRSRILFAVLTLLVTSSVTTPGQQPPEIISFETVIKYMLGGPLDADTPIVKVVTNRREWKKVWKLAHTAFQDRPPLPEIDFDNRILVAVFHGYTGGQCSTSITGLAKTEDGLQVYAKQTCPGASCGPQPASVLKPVEVVMIDRVEKSIRKKEPELFVELKFNECDPPR